MCPRNQQLEQEELKGRLRRPQSKATLVHKDLHELRTSLHGTGRGCDAPPKGERAVQAHLAEGIGAVGGSRMTLEMDFRARVPPHSQACPGSGIVGGGVAPSAPQGLAFHP